CRDRARVSVCGRSPRVARVRGAARRGPGGVVGFVFGDGRRRLGDDASLSTRARSAREVHTEMTLLDACREVMRDNEVLDRYPNGLDGNDILTEIRRKHPGAFPLVSVLDVVDEMRSFFGPGR